VVADWLAEADLTMMTAADQLGAAVETLTPQ